jgi:hypothetical protein
LAGTEGNTFATSHLSISRSEAVSKPHLTPARRDDEDRIEIRLKQALHSIFLTQFGIASKKTSLYFKSEFWRNEWITKRR